MNRFIPGLLLVTCCAAATASARPGLAVEDPVAGSSLANDAGALNQFGLGANRPGGIVPPAMAQNVLPRPIPVPPSGVIRPGPLNPNGGPFGWNEAEGPMHPPVGTNVTPVPLPSPFGLAVTGALAVLAVRRRRSVR